MGNNTTSTKNKWTERHRSQLDAGGEFHDVIEKIAGLMLDTYSYHRLESMYRDDLPGFMERIVRPFFTVLLMDLKAAGSLPREDDELPLLAPILIRKAERLDIALASGNSQPIEQMEEAFRLIANPKTDKVLELFGLPNPGKMIAENIREGIERIHRRDTEEQKGCAGETRPQ